MPTKRIVRYIYRPWIIDPRTGRRRYPRHSRVFRIPIYEDVEEEPDQDSETTR